MSRAKHLPLAFLACAVAITAGCSRDMSDLERYIGDVNARPGGRIEPLPVIEPYESFTYNAYEERSPFVPERPTGSGADASRSLLRPDSARPREYLEQFPLDTLSMVGTLIQDEVLYGLVQTTDTLVHRVRNGNYVGQNDGRITSIDDSEIRVVEIVPDGIGGYMERPAAISLGED